MTAKEFLTDKTLQAIDIAAWTAINLVVDDLAYALASNTSNLQVGTPLQRVTDYIITDDVITYGEFTLDLATTDML
jgi:hypothetical protein